MISTFAGLLLALTPFAEAECGLMGCMNMVAAGQALPVAAMHDMEGGRWLLQVAPAYWRMDAVLNPDGPDSDARVETTGYGVSLSLKREFSRNWGAGLIVSASKGKDFKLGSKDSGLGSSSQPDGGASIPGPSKGPGGRFEDHHSDFVALMLTWDPFGDPEGFRMPISVGPAYFDHGMTFKGGTIVTAELERKTMGLIGNISLDFLLGDFRVMPGILYVNFFSGTVYGPNGGRIEYDYVTPAGTFKGLYDAPDNSGSIYTTFQYRPWNLSFNWTLPVIDLKQVKVYSLTWSKTWGA